MPPRTEPRAVWIVDDSPTDAARAKAALEADYAVRVFSDGASVLEELQSSRAPDVLVLDWVMPGITGLEVCRFLRTSRPLESIGILLVTAHGSSDQVVEALEAGANDYVGKPWIDAELRARVGSLVRSRELTERVEAAESRSRALLASAPDALLEIDACAVIRYANDEAAHVFATPAAQLVGQALAALAPELRFDAEPRNGGQDAPADVRIGERIFSPSVRVLGEGPAQRRLVSLWDVTAQRRAESRRLDFYSIIAHDLRSPLMAVQLRTDAILRGRRGIMPAELLADMRKIQANIRSLVAMINDFLDLAKLEGAAYELERVPVDLGQLVCATADDFRPLAEASQLVLETVCTSTLHVLGDRSRLAQVVSNLVGNALKFTPPGGSVRVIVEPHEGNVLCRVIDTGRGIAQEALASIFERYTRAIDTRHEVAGTGLGLMIVREIVQAHAGRVGVESTLGEGSVFWFELPLA